MSKIVVGYGETVATRPFENKKFYISVEKEIPDDIIENEQEFINEANILYEQLKSAINEQKTHEITQNMAFEDSKRVDW
ncbi:MAG: hypothetical protein WC942_08575 [Clostridia bacterium]|jgi:hypothetical protein